jgi:DNA adenine methylase
MLSTAHLRLAGSYIENLDWQECIRRYDRPHTLFYLDPPYWQTEGYGVPFEFEQYEKMAEWLGKIQGKAIVSLNDHPDIRRVFDGFSSESVEIAYSCGAGKPAHRKELIIYSWDTTADMNELF